MTVTVSIIVHNDFSRIQQAVDSLLKYTSLPLTIYITINTGMDPKVDELRRRFPDVRYVINDQPRGFAANHNAVMRLATTPYVLLLNDDVEVAPAMLDILVGYLEEHQEVGLVTPCVINPDGTPQLTAFSDPTLLRMLYKISGLGYWTRQGSWIRKLYIRSGMSNAASLKPCDVTRDVPVAVGVAMCVRRSACEDAGLMDEDTLVYGEEMGWHWRLRRAGWKIVVVADTHVTHFNVEQKLEGWVLAEHRRGILNYFCRYRCAWQAWSIRAGIVFFHGIRYFFNLIFNRQAAPGDRLAVQMAIRFQPSRVMPQ
jgi:GT2 family glycosyltransferase